MLNLTHLTRYGNSLLNSEVNSESQTKWRTCCFVILVNGDDKESLETKVSVKLTISRTKSYAPVIALAGILYY